MNLRWKLNRLRAMGIRELGFRVQRAMLTNVERATYRDRVPSAVGRCGRPWVDELPRHFSSDLYVKAAERTIAGRFNVFALRDVYLGFPPRWNRDPKTLKEAPLIFGKLLDYRSAALVGDIKYVWELNRHLELVTLAQAWHLTGNRRYGLACRTLLNSWFEQCPYPLGVHWTSSLEHAVRLANWSFAWHLLGGEKSDVFSDEAGKTFKRRWLDSIYRHCHFIAGYLSRFSSANNHLLGELTGLFIGATTWPLWDKSQRWQDAAHRELEREALMQTTSDGVNREQATWYHHSVADMMLLAGLIGRANDHDFSTDYWRRLEAMLEFIASIMDVGGHVPNFGDADDGVMVRLVPDEIEQVFVSLLATGAVLFRRDELKAKAQHFDDKSRWLLGDCAEDDFKALTATPTAACLPIRRSFAEGGYYVLGEHFETPQEVRIVADAGPLGYLSIAAHGHADALSFVMSVGGRAFLVDGGTYAYHTQQKWRDYFRGTAAHNTIRIDGVDQSAAGGSFLWLERANTVVEHFECEVDADRLIAAHDGYERLTDPVRHRRAISYEHRTGVAVIEDELLCKGEHCVEIFWHVAPTWQLSLHEHGVVVSDGALTARFDYPPDLDLRLISAAEEPPLGWMSTRLDEKYPCNTIVTSGKIRGATVFLTRIRVASAACDI